MSIVARDGRIVFLTRVVAGRRDVVCVLTRGAVRGADLRVTEPWVEVAVAPHTEAWTILRRVLPRDAALRRAPRTKVRHDPVVPRAVLTRPRPEHTSEYARWMADVFAQTPAFVEVCASPRRVVVVGEGREVSWIPGPRTLYRCEGDVVASVSDGDLATTLLSTLRLR
ncbi:hypothetical protein [uncultured Tessaracoccus sp.]|uniref:hypothetical protein n=1 Tax=uncultured Tessaracoccus sp. TaxID=905023 RepID=UPI0025E2F417|nr:hypothetical protein [uncultured Tessaracoccus sp.]